MVGEVERRRECSVGHLEFPAGQISMLGNEISVRKLLWSANQPPEKYGRRLPGGKLIIYPPPPTVSNPTTRLDSGDTLRVSLLGIDLKESSSHLLHTG